MHLKAFALSRLKRIMPLYYRYCIGLMYVKARGPCGSLARAIIRGPSSQHISHYIAYQQLLFAVVRFICLGRGGYLRACASSSCFMFLDCLQTEFQHKLLVVFEGSIFLNEAVRVGSITEIT